MPATVRRAGVGPVSPRRRSAVSRAIGRSWSADEFLDGQPDVQKRPDTNELVIPLDARPEKPTVVVLGWKQADAPAKPKK